jgi:Cu+-exporting ATPase
MEENITLNVEGMTCANCANTITRTLEKEGLKNVSVNYLTSEVRFENIEEEKLEYVKKQIDKIGYHVVSNPIHNHAGEHQEGHVHEHSSSVEKKFIWSAVFTVPLLFHMILQIPFLHEPIVQLFLCLPVMYIGMNYFGKSAWGSLKSGAPNMDVLISIGSIAAFVYSTSGMILFANTPEVHEYLFFETAAAIICFVLLGNLLEHRAVKQTTSALHELSKMQPHLAKKISSGNNSEETITEVNVNEIAKGDFLLVNTGDKIPVDGKIFSGNAMLNESIITGESIPVNKEKDDLVIGGTIVENGSLKIIAERAASEGTLSKIIELVKSAQLAKPEIQKLGDRVSNIFVPVVLAICVLTFIISHFAFDISAGKSLMRSIAVLVISCPCAMGLATPTALMVGIGRAARNGILIKGGNTVEQFAKIKTIVFDKTGTLTTGNFRIKSIHAIQSDEREIKILLCAIEQHSSHPIAKSIQKELKEFSADASKLKWKNISEDKGIGINATDESGNLFSVGSFVMAKHITQDSSHQIYLLKNNSLIATVDLEDEVKQGVKGIISELKSSGIKTVLLSGDRKNICEAVAKQIGIEEVYSEQLPHQKLEIISRLGKEGFTAMVGDGINDAPALAKATVGVSLSDATQVAIQSAQIVLLHSNELKSLLLALKFCKQTLLTIKQNLFWAFFYNVIAIPIAAAGFLSPVISALTMAFSDVVLVINSIRLRFKKIV